MDTMRRRAMGQTFSWKASAKAYAKLYKNTLAHAA
jgi:glycogen synthase